MMKKYYRSVKETIGMWLCGFDFHREEYYDEIVYEYGKVTTTNTTEKCARCGKVLGEYGTTSVGPFNICIGESENE